MRVVDGGNQYNLYSVARAARLAEPSTPYGAGAAEGAMDASNMLKPMLGRGELHLTIPPRTNANQTFRLHGKGMPHLRDPNKRGDMFARVKLVLPDSLTDQEVNAIHSPPQSFSMQCHSG